MGKVRQCFLCSRVLARSERRVAEAMTSGAGAAIVEVCDWCQRAIVRAGAIATSREERTVVLRPQPEQAQLFQGAWRQVSGTGGRHG